jgi:DNA-binding XRE family transcriptional regulator
MASGEPGEDGMSEDREFRNITAEVDELLARPDMKEPVAQHLAEMRDADRAYAMGLAALRRAADLTQTELANQLGVTQTAISHMERRRDLLLSTLSSYIEAIGGRMRVVVAFEGGREIEVDLSELTGSERPSEEAEEEARMVEK